MARRKADAAPAAEETVKTATVHYASGLNLREAPALDAPVVRVLRDGEKIKIDSGKNSPAGWLPVDGGFVMARYVTV